MNMNEVIANNIISLLKQQNKKQQELADGIGSNKQIVSKMLNTSRSINAIELKKIANFLGVSMESLVKIPEDHKDNSFVEIFSNQVRSEEGRRALEIADTLSDMILFHSRIRENGIKRLQEEADIWNGTINRSYT